MNTNSQIGIEALASSLHALENGGSTERVDAFLDIFLSVAAEQERLVISEVENDLLRVCNRNEILCELQLSRARPKLRALCARLAVRCSEWSGETISPYGGEVEIQHPDIMQRCLVRLENSPNSQRIEVECIFRDGKIAP